jgi:hypothetical protein
VDWSRELDTQARAFVASICDRAQPPAGRDAAWRELLIRIAPHIESWASRSRVLRRCNLTSEDDVRSVLVEVMRRLANHDFEILRAFRDRRPPSLDDERDADEQDVIEKVVRLLSDDDELPAERSNPSDTPLRAWLLKVVGFATKDHVRSRLGRPAGHAGTKRDVNTGAAPLSDAPEAGERPPFTDLVTTRRLLEEIRDVVITFSPTMQRALALWADDTNLDGIASELALDGADSARDLIRAATARLRDRFRNRYPALVHARA